MKKPKAAPAPVAKKLPEGIIESDTHYPQIKYTKDYKKIKNPQDEVARELGDHGALTFYETTAFGWCIATLAIAKARRGANRTDRTYAIRLSDGASVRVGAGPHVTRTVTVYIKKGRAEALKKYTDLFASGQVRANEIRDRISSRRLQGVEMRALGRSSWRWDR